MNDSAHTEPALRSPRSHSEPALRHVYQVPLVPVVHRADFRRLEGVISREDVLEKYKMPEGTA